MSLGKKDIIKNIFSKAQVSKSKSILVLESFIAIIKKESISRTVKLSKFGSFSTNTSKSRIGRNPLTGENFDIPERPKLSLKPSKRIKDFLN